MKTYIILFRGINVGGRNLLPMKELKTLLEDGGYENVQTYIQSGNVILRAKSNPLKTIASKVATKFGFSPEVLALEKPELDSIINANPYPSFEGKTVHFYFCSKEPKLNTQKLESYVACNEEFQLKANVFYLHAPDGIGRSKLVSNIGTCLGVSATGRNLNTVLRIKEMAKNA